MECTICETKLTGLACKNEWCGEVHAKCCKCDVIKSQGEMYEHRGSDLACENCIDEVIETREFKRQEIINEENNKTKAFNGLDIDSTNTIGKANHQILKRHIEIASKESGRLKDYEGR